VAGVPGPPRPPNHPKTIHKPPTRRREAAGDEEAEKVLAAYPPDRLRCKAACLAQIEEAIKEGIAPEDLLQAVQAYASDSVGFTRSKDCFSDNWLQSRRWQAYVEKQAEDREKSAALEADHHARLPEVLRGNPDRTEALIDASRHQWTYRAGVISFAAEDAPTEEQQAEVMDHFERLAFAGQNQTTLTTQSSTQEDHASMPHVYVLPNRSHLVNGQSLMLLRMKQSTRYVISTAQ